MDRRAKHPRNGSSGSSAKSYASDHSKSTAPTNFSNPSPSKKTQINAVSKNTEESLSETATCASTGQSSVDEDEKDEPIEEEPDYEVMDRTQAYRPSDALPSNPGMFADLFPSSRKLLIRHDDSTLDGNMNLRIDTPIVREGGHQYDVTLFHLRVYDLHSRRFSLRRYCRDSGREVCHSSRKPSTSSSSSSSLNLLRQPWNNVLTSLRPKTVKSTSNDKLEPAGVGEEESHSSNNSNSKLSHTLMLEFSNYAHVELTQRGASGSKGYEYWSTRYQWKRRTRKQGDMQETSYHLANSKTGKMIAHIIPSMLSRVEAIEETSRGGWVPPSCMWIEDGSSLHARMPDIAE